jgi:glycosyltransferase involved in cell wall biosynthesis
MKRRIVVVNSMYTEGMGYLENCLPAALARLGHEVHVVASTFNQYANEPMYDEVYGRFVGPRQVPPQVKEVDGYTLHRLDATLLRGYVRTRGLAAYVDAIGPDVVYSCEVASLDTFALVFGRPTRRYSLFCGTHQTASVLKPFLLDRNGSRARKGLYWLTRTLPTRVASGAVKRVYAHAPDCLEVAARFYGIPHRLLVLRPLATDPERFHPATTNHELAARSRLRASLGFTDEDVVCLYSGRFSDHKNPLVLAQAIERLRASGARFRGLFVGDGPQEEAIAASPGSTTIPFMRYGELPDYYRAADIAVWPRQESMSMLDAAACALPVIVSNTMSDPARIAGNGLMYDEDSVPSLVDALRKLASPETRRTLGARGRARMIEQFSWLQFARELESDIARLD